MAMKGVIQEILETAYPQELRDLAPVDRLDRDKIVRWFVAQGLGGGAAQNKASTYIRVASGVSASDNPKQAVRPTSPRPTRTANQPARQPKKTLEEPPSDDSSGGDSGKINGKGRERSGRPDLNINVQIHISADSSAEQIDAIFSAMRKYFDGSPDSQ
jgi:hypothetical protein